MAHQTEQDLYWWTVVSTAAASDEDIGTDKLHDFSGESLSSNFDAVVSSCDIALGTHHKRCAIVWKVGPDEAFDHNKVIAIAMQPVNQNKQVHWATSTALFVRRRW